MQGKSFTSSQNLILNGFDICDQHGAVGLPSKLEIIVARAVIIPARQAQAAQAKTGSRTHQQRPGDCQCILTFSGQSQLRSVVFIVEKPLFGCNNRLRKARAQETIVNSLDMTQPFCAALPATTGIIRNNIIGG